MGNQAGIIIRNVKNELFHSAKRLILNEVKGIECLQSIQSFCVKNKVPYNIFSKWYKDTRKQIVEVKVDGRPSDSEKEPCVQSDFIQPAAPSPVRIMIELRMSNGLHLSHSTKEGIAGAGNVLAPANKL